jgi:hypothetical protein
MVPGLRGFGRCREPRKERFSGPYDFENEFQFQLQGYAPAAKTVNPDAHNHA